MSIFEIKLKRVELLNFENYAGCVIYVDTDKIQFYYQFVDLKTEEVDKLNSKLAGPFSSLSESKHEASIYYQKEWLPF